MSVRLRCVSVIGLHVLYTVHFTAFCLGGGVSSRTRCIMAKLNCSYRMCLKKQIGNVRLGIEWSRYR